MDEPNMTHTYSCTAPFLCHVPFKFTSYTAWAHHERMWHHDAFRIYYCHREPALGSEYQCELGFYTEADFLDHRRLPHKMRFEQQNQEISAGDYLLGPIVGMYGRRFWCGFCRDVFEVGGAEDWYAVRAEHVAAHFTGEPPARFVVDFKRDWTDIVMYRPEVTYE